MDLYINLLITIPAILFGISAFILHIESIPQPVEPNPVRYAYRIPVVVAKHEDYTEITWVRKY